MELIPVGDSAVLLRFEQKASPEINAQVQAADAAIRDAGWDGILETIPAFASLLVEYDPARLSYADLSGRLQTLNTLESSGKGDAFVYTIPVCYGGSFGEDLEDVAEHAGISVDEVIRRHSAVDYRIYMLGFLPGFPYLGGLDESIACPRLSSPRQRIAPGSVGIGGSQTGVYPIASPGGWRLIGTTPLKLYDPNREEPILYRAGDSIRFAPITQGEFETIARQVEEGTYVLEKEAVR